MADLVVNWNVPVGVDGGNRGDGRRSTVNEQRGRRLLIAGATLLVTLSCALCALFVKSRGVRSINLLPDNSLSLRTDGLFVREREHKVRSAAMLRCTAPATTFASKSTT